MTLAVCHNRLAAAFLNREEIIKGFEMTPDSHGWKALSGIRSPGRLLFVLKNKKGGQRIVHTGVYFLKRYIHVSRSLASGP